MYAWVFSLHSSEEGPPFIVIRWVAALFCNLSDGIFSKHTNKIFNL